jgi:SET domain-containing protein
LIAIIHFSLRDEDWIDPRTVIRQSGIHGKGLYAKEPISEGDLVVVWGGTYVGVEEAEKARQNGKIVTQWDDNLFSVEHRGESSGYFINHSCEPNLWMIGAFALATMRTIQAGEELTADYAMWEADEDFSSDWSCKCGSGKCRHRVTGSDWRLRELQERYQKHFSPLINKRIEKNAFTQKK